MTSRERNCHARIHPDRGARGREDGRPADAGGRRVRNQGFVEATAARRISFADSLAFERIHEETYLELGFRLVEVPAGPLGERVALISRCVSIA